MEQPAKKFGNNNNSKFGGNNAGGNRPRRFGGRKPLAEKPEFDQKIINVRRVARVVAGGRRFSFSVALVAGDKNGRVGVGIGKAGDTALAMTKAFNKAKHAMVKVALTKTKSIPHEVTAKFKAAQVVLRPAKGRGLVAGSALRVVLALAGAHDINAKILSRSKDKLNIARATVLALSSLKSKS
ncbi:MAG: 30S ribosomal protein S5 [Candidatus Vogelbacteria bacterium]|nr:30S ribosomal protein S5 [Candidatus Vogelbacteria bacterium]